MNGAACLVMSAALLLAIACPGAAENMTPAPNKTGVGPTAVDLPSGPGSVTGFGAGYDWRLSGNKGAYRYRIEIPTPSGPAGLAPTLRLAYGSDLGAGSLGLGWRLDMPFVERDSSTRLPLYDETDRRLRRVFPREDEVFQTEAGVRLRQDDTGDYFAEHERSFVRYRREGTGWRAQYPDGTQLLMGLSALARLQSEDGARVFRWLAERLVDPHGNEIAFEYEETASSSDGNEHARRLVRIEYGAGASPRRAAHIVWFDYEPRPDVLFDGRAGFLVENRTRLKVIEVLSQDGGPLGPPIAEALDRNEDGIPERLVRRYHFGYAHPSRTGAVSLLARVTEFGRDGISALPSTTFEYTGQNTASTDNVARRGLSTTWLDINARISSAAVELADVNADALPDLIVTPGSPHVPHLAALNLGISGRTPGAGLEMGDPMPMRGDERSQAVTLASVWQDATLADFNGDGRVDLGYRGESELLYFFPGDGAAGWNSLRALGNQYRTPRRFARADSPVRQADLDGDRRIDLIRTSSNGRTLSVWFCLENGNYSRAVVWDCPEECDFRRPGTLLSEVTGDGLPDLVWIRTGEIRMAPGLGFGRFARVRSIRYPGDVSLEPEDFARARLIDVTGDGLSDLVIPPRAAGALLLAVNRGGEEFGPWITISDMPAPSHSHAKGRWADMNGDGAADYVLLEDTRHQGPRITVLNLLRALDIETKPNLMSRVNNGRGLVSEIAYTTAAAQMSVARAEGRPWRTTTPNPLVLVASVKESTYPHEVSEETRYLYRDGIYTQDMRVHRGFETIDTISVGGETEHPTGVTRTWFERGDNHAALNGLARLVKVMDGERRLHEETETVWSNPPRAMRYRGNEPVSHFAHPQSVISRLFAEDNGEPVTLISHHTYDNAGNLTSHVEVGAAAENDVPVDPSIRRTTLAEYILDEERWMLRARRREAVLDYRGMAQTETLYYYDDESFGLGGFGTISRGLHTMTRRRVAPGGSTETDSTGLDNWITDARHRYDAYGNRVLTAGALARIDADGGFSTDAGHLSRFEMDPVWHSRVVGETVVVDANVSLANRFEYDRDFGFLSVHTDPAGARSRFDYDTFGRLSAIYFADDAAGLPSVRYRYAVGVDAAGDGRISWIDTLLLDDPAAADESDGAYLVSRRFIDGKGRALYTKLEDAGRTPDTAGANILGIARFSARGALTEALTPLCSGTSGGSVCLGESLRCFLALSLAD